MSGLSITNGYDAFLRRTAVALASQSSTWTSYSYDTASRVLGVSNGSESAAYTYLANSMLISNIVFKQSGNTRLTVVGVPHFRISRCT